MVIYIMTRCNFQLKVDQEVDYKCLYNMKNYQKANYKNWKSYEETETWGWLWICGEGLAFYRVQSLGETEKNTG